MTEEVTKIWEKGDFFLIGGKRIDMDPAVVELPKVSPLTFGFNWTVDMLGHVEDIRLEDGEILGTPVFSDETVDYEVLPLRLGGFYKGIEYADESKTRVSKATLKAVSLVLKSDMPGFKRKE